MKVHIIPAIAAVAEGGCKNCLRNPITNSKQKFTLYPLHRLSGKLKMTSSFVTDERNDISVASSSMRAWSQNTDLRCVFYDMVRLNLISAAATTMHVLFRDFDEVTNRCTRLGRRRDRHLNFHFRNDGQCNGVLAWPDHATVTTFIQLLTLRGWSHSLEGRNTKGNQRTDRSSMR